MFFFFFFFSSRRRHTRCALVTGVQTCALPILNETPPCPKHDDRSPPESPGNEQQAVGLIGSRLRGLVSHTVHEPRLRHVGTYAYLYGLTKPTTSVETPSMLGGHRTLIGEIGSEWGGERGRTVG